MEALLTGFQPQNAGDQIRAKTGRMLCTARVDSDHVCLGDPRCATTDRAFTAAEWPVHPQKTEETYKAGSQGERTLLEVFETELAKKPRDAASQTDSPGFPLLARPAPVMPESTKNANFPACETCISLPEPAPTTIEDGIKTAVRGFEVCIRGIVETLKAIESPTSDEAVSIESTKFCEILRIRFSH